jgi:hypothetical protein
MGFDAVFRHAWLLLIAVTCANAGVWWVRGKNTMAEQPEREDGYRRLIRGWLIYGNVPWLVMGVGVVFGEVRSVFDYFDPQNGPYVVAWYVSVVIIWVLLARWVFFAGGADELVKHPGLLNHPPQDPRTVKGLLVLMLMGGVAGLTMMILGFGRDLR